MDSKESTDTLYERIQNVDQDMFSSFPRDKEFFRHGAFGSVERALWNKQVIAIKYFKNRDQYNKNYSELEQLALCKCENIVNVLGAGPDIKEKKVCYYIMEFADCGSLDDILHKIRPQVAYTLGQGLNWALQCARAVAYLHGSRDRPIIHRDLKPGNLLLFDQGRLVKLCDFGTTKIAHTENTAETGTYLYMAPEVMVCMTGKKAKYDEKCDVFSWTIILWEILTRQKPYSKLTSVAMIVWKVVIDRQHLEDIPNCPEFLQKLIHRSWHYNPRMRPPMRDIVQVFELITAHMTGVHEPLDLPVLFPEIQPPATPKPAPVDAGSDTSSTGLLTPQPNSGMGDAMEDDIRQAYLADLKPIFKLVDKVPGDDESERLYAQHDSLLNSYLQLRYECDRLYQTRHDFETSLADPDDKEGVLGYCKKLGDVEELQGWLDNGSFQNTSGFEH